MRKGQETQNKLEFRLKNKENRQKAGLKSCFWALITHTNGTNRLFWVARRDVGFWSPNRGCPDEIGTVGKYGNDFDWVHEMASMNLAINSKKNGLHSFSRDQERPAFLQKSSRRTCPHSKRDTFA